MKYIMIILLVAITNILSAQVAPNPGRAVRPGEIGQTIQTGPDGSVNWYFPEVKPAGLDSYDEGDIVRDAATGLYRANAATVTSPPGADWVLIGGQPQVEFDNFTVLTGIGPGTVINGTGLQAVKDVWAFAPPTLALAGPTGLYERGTVNELTYTVTTSNPAGTTLSNGRIERNGSTVQSFDGQATATYTFTFAPGAPSGDNADAYTVRAYQDYTGAKSGTDVASPARTVESVLPILYGTSATQLTGATVYDALSHRLVKESNQTVTLSGTDVYAYYLIPAEWGDTDLSQIKDPNNLQVDIDATFTRTTITVTTSTTNQQTADFIKYQTRAKIDIDGPYQFIR